MKNIIIKLKMKKLIFSLLIILIINEKIDKRHIIPNLLISKEEAKNKILKVLRKEGSKAKYNYPPNYKNYFTNLRSSTIIKFDQIQFSQIDSLKTTHNFPIETINKFKKMKYVSNTMAYETFEFSINKARTKIENIFGVATRLDANNLYFAYVQGEVSANAIIQFQTVSYQSCSTILFWEKCETKYKKVKRGFTNSELDIIQEALKVKFYQTLNSILDLDKQKALSRFKQLAQSKRVSYPQYYQKYAPLIQTFIDFETINLESTYSIDYLKHQGFDLQTRDKIVSLLDRPNNYIETYQILKRSPNEYKLRMGVAYGVSNDKITFSYVEAVSLSKSYKDYCVVYSGFLGLFMEQIQTCKDDPECVESCNNYRKIVRDYNNPINEIPGLSGDKKKFDKNLEQILLADITNKISDILNEIKF